MTKCSSHSFYYAQALSDIGSKMPPDFTIVNNEKEYKIRSFVASNISQKIYLTILEDASADRYFCNLDDETFGSVVDVLNGKNVEVSEKNCASLFIAACEFLISSLAEDAMAQIINNKNLKLITEMCKKGFESCIDVEPLVNEVAAQLSSVIDEVSQFPEPLVDMILQSPLLDKKVDKNAIVQLVANVGKIDENHNSRLLKDIPPSMFDDDKIKSVITAQDFNVNLLRSVLIKNHSQTKVAASDTEVVPGEELLSGIIKNYLTPIVTATSFFSQKYTPSNLLSDDDTFYCSLDKGNSKASVTFDFTPKKVELSHYTLKSWRIAGNGVAPISWSVEVSVNGESWTEVSKIEDCLDLTNNSAIKLYALDATTEPVSFVRINQMKNGNPGNMRFALSAVEFFGTIKN